MSRSVRLAHSVRLFAAGTVALVAAVSLSLTVLANVALTQVSSDPYTNTTSQHATQVEPDSFAWGSTIVMAGQTGRFYDGGSSNICWSTSTNAGASWPTQTPPSKPQRGCLPGITTYSTPAGPYDRVSDPAVAYDAKHDVWMISSLALSGSNVTGAAVLVSRSTDGGLTWINPVTVPVTVPLPTATDVDKSWIVCDNTTTSHFYGNCYTEWDNFGDNDRIYMSTSTDGGLTWGAGLKTGNSATGLGGQPVVQPSGTVIVPVANANETAILAFSSSNGGTSWSSTVTIASVADHAVAGGLRTDALPSAEIDADGKVYVVWQDCRFRRGCGSNDIVMSTSTNGTTWTTPVRIPIDATSTKVDHFIPGLAVDPTTSGSTARLGLTYYYYPTAKCTSSTCQLNVGFISSTDGGTHWSAPTQLAGPMSLSWLPNTSQGRMVGDYISTSFAGGSAHPALSLANAPTGTVFNQSLSTTSTGLSAASGVTVSVGNEKALPGAASDHAAPQAAFHRR